MARHADKPPFVSGVILAAGSASRMGRPKQLMVLGDRSILQRVVDEAFASRLDEIVIVLGAHAADIQDALHVAHSREVRFVVNADYRSGLSSSLRCGLKGCRPVADAAAILLGDQPGVGAHLIDRMLEAYAETRAELLRPIFAARGRAEVPGHPVILARGVWPEVAALRGDEGARVLFARDESRVREVRIAAEPPMDIDTLQDYHRAAAVDEAAAAATRGG